MAWPVSPPGGSTVVFIEALNSLLGLLLVLVAVQLRRMLRNSSVFRRGMTFLLVAAVMVTARELAFFVEVFLGVWMARDLLTTATFVVLAYSAYSIREEWRRVFEKLGGLAF